MVVAQNASVPYYVDAYLLRGRRRPGLCIMRKHVEILLLRIRAGRRRPKSLMVPVAGGRPAARDMEQPAGMSHPARSSHIVPLVLGGEGDILRRRLPIFRCRGKSSAQGLLAPKFRGDILSPSRNRAGRPQASFPSVPAPWVWRIEARRATACGASGRAAAGKMPCECPLCQPIASAQETANGRDAHVRTLCRDSL
jgi:hypothetical protein